MQPSSLFRRLKLFLIIFGIALTLFFSSTLGVGSAQQQTNHREQIDKSGEGLVLGKPRAFAQSPTVNDEDEDGSPEDIIGREKLFIQQRTFPFDSIPIGARERALKQVRERMKEINPNVSGNAWLPFGPDSIPNGQVF